MRELVSSMPTSAGLYYFSVKMASAKRSALASWTTGWSNITGQVTLICSINHSCAELITTGIAMAADGAASWVTERLMEYFSSPIQHKPSFAMRSKGLVPAGQ